MKANFLKVMIVLFIGVLTLEGCKKGENDPLISLRSRDARVTGEWKLVEFESTSTEVYTDGTTTVTETRTDNYDGSIWTRTTPGGTDSYSYSQDLIIEKDGKFAFKVSNDGDREEANGRWSWLDDAKNKRRILLDDVYNIDQLKNSEMIFTEDRENSSVDSDGASYKETYTSTARYEKQ